MPVLGIGTAAASASVLTMHALVVLPATILGARLARDALRAAR